MIESHVDRPSNRTRQGPERGSADLAAVIFALAFPSAVTWVYFVTLAQGESQWQQTAYAIGKFIQFAFPAFWVAVVQRRWEAIRCTRRGLGLGLVSGVLIALAMVILYFGVLRPGGYFAQASEEIVQKVQGFGVNSTFAYAGLALFYAICHSGLEEYYWRWFVYRQLTAFVTRPIAMVLSSVGFMAHHVIVLGVFFGWNSPLTWFFSISVAVGGMIWAWLYERSGSIFAVWLSHLIVDAAIFAIGYEIVGKVF